MLLSYGIIDSQSCYSIMYERTRMYELTCIHISFHHNTNTQCINLPHTHTYYISTSRTQQVWVTSMGSSILRIYSDLPYIKYVYMHLIYPGSADRISIPLSLYVCLCVCVCMRYIMNPNRASSVSMYTRNLHSLIVCEGWEKVDGWMMGCDVFSW